MTGRPEVRVALDIADSSIRERFLQALGGCSINPSQPGEEATVIVKDRLDGGEDPAIPVVHLWQVGRGRKKTGGNPFASTVARNWIASAPNVRGEDVSTTLTHLSSRRFIGLQQLIPSPKEVVTLREQASATKSGHLDRMRAFLTKHGAGKHLRESMEFAFEEMFSNAVYNAPVDAAGVHMNAGKRRTESVISDRPFVIEYRIDEQHIGLSVCDAYGTLGADRILDCLRRCYGEGGAQFEEKSGGAGLGFFMILQQATRLIANVKAGQFSEIIVLRRLGESRQQFMMSTPTLNLCFVSNDHAATTSRRYKRMPVRWAARILINGVERATTILDISPAGAFVALDVSPDDVVRDSGVTLVSTPSGTQPPIAARARVCWVGMSNTHRSPGMGIEFVPPLNASDVDGWQGS